MAQKINTITHRLGVTIPWSSRWMPKKATVWHFLEEDCEIRKFVMKKILQAGIAGIVIERTGDMIRVTIQASKPGLIIGRGGKGIEDLKAELVKAILKLRKKNAVKEKFVMNLTIEELKRSEISSSVVAQNIAFDIEKRMPYRRVIKRQLESIKQNREVKGAKIKVSGRLNGAEISRSDFLSSGSMPLQTLRANIDYGTATAFNTYGTIGIKVWIYRGEIFSKTARETK